MTQGPFDKSSSASGRHLLFEFGSPSNGKKSALTSEFRSRLHRSLRAATRSDQMMIDRMILRLNLARREDYGLFLNAHYLSLRDLSVAWRNEDHDEFLSMAHCLQQDLHSIGFAPSALHSAARMELTDGARLGIAYIIRGSRHDAMSIRHRVPLQYGATYLDFSPALSWSRFLEQLERHVSQVSEQDETLQLISGAKLALAKFGSFLKEALA
jgi:heme oxygenase